MKKHLIIASTIILGTIVFACKKNEAKKHTALQKELVLLKNGKFYSKDSIVNKLSEYAKVDKNSIIYDESLRTFFLREARLELNPLDYMKLD